MPRTHIPAPSADAIAVLQDKIYGHYHANPRPLPWRLTFDPYAILVSEVMLQQTTVERVLPKYTAFLEKFPDIHSLAAAPLHAVMTMWQGLGYNRRGLSLKRAAETIDSIYDGTVPETPETLQSLPGIGAYTAAAVAVFAYGTPLVLVETNIRTVFIHEFFPDAEKIRDRELVPFIEAAIDRSAPREWYYALMDYGVMLKKTMKNPSRRSAHYSRQSPFAGSRREMRSRILREVLAAPGCTTGEIAKQLGIEPGAVTILAELLEKEGLITNQDGRFFI